VPEDLGGFGNPWSWGTRMMLNFGDFFYAGAATACNLKTGFRIVKRTPQSRPVGPPLQPPQASFALPAGIA